MKPTDGKSRIQERARLSLLLLFCVYPLFRVNTAFARPPEEAEFSATSVLGEDIADWVDGLEKRPQSVGVFSVRVNQPLEQDYANIVEAELLKNLARNGFNNVISCTECKGAQVSVQDDRLVITKGTPDGDTLRRVGSKYPVDAFLAVEIYRTKFSVIAQVILYENTTGVVLNAERFHVAALSISEASAQVLLTVGLGKVLTPSSSISNSPLATMGNVSLLEELGFGKGGLNVGAITSSQNGTLVWVTPTLGFRGHWGRSALGWSLHLGAGYGFTSQANGFMFRGAYDFYLGPLASWGFEGGYFLPDHSVNTLQSFVGFHIGLSFGR